METYAILGSLPFIGMAITILGGRNDFKNRSLFKGLRWLFYSAASVSGFIVAFIFIYGSFNCAGHDYYLWRLIHYGGVDMAHLHLTLWKYYFLSYFKITFEFAMIVVLTLIIPAVASRDAEKWKENDADIR